MDIATIAGIAVGTLIIIIAIFIGGDFGSFVNIPSLLIVIGGGIAATVIRFPVSNIFTSLALGAKVAFTHKTSDPKEMINQIAELAETVRKNGPLSLENVEIADEFLSKGTRFIADGHDSEFILATLEKERDLSLERLDEAQRLYTALGDSAPAFGMIGTLVGLVQMLSTMDDPSTIGPAMAVALLTTLYGAVIANIVALPIADKLSTKSKIAEIGHSMSIDGIMQIRENKSPAIIKEMLLSYLPEKSRHVMVS
jgi:chemotaxis protein MotA